jgi:protein SDA1
MGNTSEESLASRLALLQNFIKRDSECYREEFLVKLSHYNASRQLFLVQPGGDCKDLVSLIKFISQVIDKYPADGKEFPSQVMELLDKYFNLLDPDMRMNLCKTVVLLRNKCLVAGLPVLKLFFNLFRCQDKQLRKYLFHTTVAHIKRSFQRNCGHKNASQLRAFVYGKLQENGRTSRMALLMLIDLYRKNIWNDATTGNVISQACFSKSAKVMAAALKFFTGTVDEHEEDSSDSEDEGESRTLKEVMMAYRVAKKSKKRKKRMEKAKAALLKEKKRKKGVKNCGSSAILALHDPQEFADQLYKRLSSSSDRYELKLLMMALIAKVIGIHQLIILSFYQFLQRYMTPRQREVTKVLLYAAQAVHSLVPPESVEELVKCIINNFVTESNSPEVMTVGLNAIREICNNCPIAINEDTLQDLTDYKSYKNKNVTMAARGLIQLFREKNPTLLKRKDRGRPTEFTREIQTRAYGEIDVASGVAGAEVLVDSGKSVATHDGGTLPTILQDSETVSVAADNGLSWDDSDFDCSDDESDKESCNSSLMEDEGHLDKDDSCVRIDCTGLENVVSDLSIDTSGFNTIDTGLDNSKDAAELASDCADLDAEGASLDNNDSKTSRKIVFEETDSTDLPVGPDRTALSADEEVTTPLPQQMSDDANGSRSGVQTPAAKTDVAKIVATLTSDHIFTQEEFRRIRSHQLAKHVQPAIGAKRKASAAFAATSGDGQSKRPARSMESEATSAERKFASDEEDSDNEDDIRPHGLPKLADIEKIAKGTKADKAARLATIMAGREGREKFGRPKKTGDHVGKTQKAMAKRKAFPMIKHKQGGKKKRSFRDKQLALRKHLTHLAKY